jgi:ribonuclease E
MTLQSIAPCLIYEEANLIKRAIRDLYTPDIESILVEGEEGFERARDFMKMLMPSHVDRVYHYKDNIIPLFFRYQVETQINTLHSPIVRLKSGGYIVINQAEALVAIDVNSGRSTRERNIEETAYRTNMEAAEEVARQLRLRDLAGLIVIDFIDMEDGRNNSAVERRLKDAMRHDRARLQIGRISHFGLLELSRQRLRPSLLDLNFEKCPHCHGTGHIRLVESTALLALHALEEEGMRQAASEVVISVPDTAAQYILNNKREALTSIEKRYGMNVRIRTQEDVIPPEFPIERIRGKKADEKVAINLSINEEKLFAEIDRDMGLTEGGEGEGTPEEGMESAPMRAPRGEGEEAGDEGRDSNFSRPFREEGEGDGDGEGGGRRRRRGRRGGRRRGGRFREGERGGSFQQGGQDNYQQGGYERSPEFAPRDVEGNVAAPPGEGEFQDPPMPDDNSSSGPDFRQRDNFQPRGEFRQREGGGGEGREGRRHRGGRNRNRNRDRGDRDRNRGDRPRDPNRPPREFRGDRGERGNYAPRDFGPPVSNVPSNVFDIDTTPHDVLDTTPREARESYAPPQQQQREHRPEPRQQHQPQQQQQASAPRAPEPPRAPAEPPPVSHQVFVASYKKKSGWWSKFTGA